MMTHADIAAAGPDEQRAVLEALWNCTTCSGDCSAANPPVIFCPTDRFRAMLDAEAYLSAAEMLVPDGWKLRQMNFSAPCADDRKWHLNLHCGRYGEDTLVGRGRTRALALASAIARSREA